jgi:addiction module HigA family antidote
MRKNSNPRPFRPISPGEILQDELSARRWSPKRLAERMGKPLRAVNEILDARRPITAPIALALADALGVSAETWMNIESNYRLDLARRRRAAG